MERRKLESAALFLTIAGALLIMPPLAVVFQVHRRFLGIPSEVIYLFLVWAALIVGAWWLGKRLPSERIKLQDGKAIEDDG
jgi:hypothetical protein